MNKSVFKSKTFWFNLLMALSVMFPPVEEWLIANPVMFTSLWGGLGMLLRMVTKSKVVLIP